MVKGLGASGGTVLVACGADNDQYLHSAEFYDPDTESWTPTDGLFYERFGASAHMLPNGRVMVVGSNMDGVELYEPSNGAWYATGKLDMPRSMNPTTSLADGRVLIAGGYSVKALPSSPLLGTAELYDPTTQVWSFTGDLTEARYNHTATLLPDGRVLVVGGGTNTGFSHTAELFDPVTRTWAPTGSLFSFRYGHTATLLTNGRVLVAGGYTNAARPPHTFDTCELYDPAAGQ